MCKKHLFSSVVSIFFLANIAIAGRTWVKTPIEVDGMGIYDSRYALGMRSNNTWPVISYSGGTGTHTAAMTPVGWMAGPSTTVSLNLGIGTSTSSHGTVGFAYEDGFVRMMTPSGWATSYYGVGTQNTRPSIAFTSTDNPSVLHNTGGELTLAVLNGGGWYQDIVKGPSGGPYPSNAFALEYDSYNQANVAFGFGSDLKFGIKGVLTQEQWEFDVVKTGISVSSVDMAMGVGDIPWVTYTSGNYLWYATYDRQQQTWIDGIIGQVGGSGYSSMATDSTGGIGVAFVGVDDMLTYSHNDGSGSWATDIGIASANQFKDIGLAFDADDNPIICYSDLNYGDKLYLAYDPTIVPEPATLMLLTIGAAALLNMRRPVM